jgi:hypothetical protein
MSEEKDIDKLIDELSGELSPSKGVFQPVKVILPWSLLACLYIFGVMHFLGIRMDFADKITELPYLFELSLTVIMAAVSIYTAGWLAIPDMRGQKWLLPIAPLLFAVFLLWNLCVIITQGINMPEITWHHCFSDAILMAVVPVALLCMLVRTGKTAAPHMMAFTTVLAAGSLGWAALRITCMADDSGHILLFHFMPYIIIAALLGLLARRIYRW